MPKRFVSHQLPKLVFEVSNSSKEGFTVSREEFLNYWLDTLSQHHRKQALCFFTQDLIDLVNKTNSRLLCKDLISKHLTEEAKQVSTEDDDDKYQLLNAFEMLWNVNEKQS